MRHFTIALLIALSTQTSSPAPAPPPVPSQDATLSSQAATMREWKALAERAATGDQLAELDLLIRQRRNGAAIDVLARLLQGDAPQILSALELAGPQTHMIAMDHAAGHPARLGELAATLKKRLRSFPRETAARIAFALVPIEARAVPAVDYRQRMVDLMSEYAGTEPALIERGRGESLDIERSTEARAISREHFARAHPRTVAGAAALYSAGFALAHDVSADRDRDPDPTNNFFRVLDIVNELQSGAWPDSPAVRDAPKLVIEFFAPSSATYAPGNLDRVIDAYRAFVSRQIARDPATVSRYVIASKIPDLLKKKGAPLTVMDGYFDEWRGLAKDPAVVDYIRAAAYEDWMSRERADFALWSQRARDAFRALAAAGDGPQHRAALASFANLQFQAEDFRAAITTYEQYLSRDASSDLAWIVALRLGQAHEETGDWARAETAYARAAAMPASPLAAMLGWAHAGRAAEALKQPSRALRAYRRALDAWQPTGVSSHALTFRFWSGGAASRTPKSAVPVSEETLAADIRRLERALTSPDGAAVEHARSLLKQERWLDAIAAIDTLLAASPRTGSAADARYVRDLARLHHALDLADADKPSSDPAAATRVLQAVDGPWTPAVGLARIAQAALQVRGGDRASAEAAMQRALDEWRAHQPVPPGGSPLADPIAEDIAAIRQLVFQPMGGSIFQFKDPRRRNWNAFEWPKTPARFAIVRPGVRVKFADGATKVFDIFRASPGVPAVVFADDEARTLLGQILFRVGGRSTRAPRQVMETPNQPVGGSMEILAFWNRFFPARPGHWGGWDLETFPVITELEFYDAARTRAGAKVTIGYSGATVVLQKIDGSWRAVDLTNFWIT